MPNGDLGDFIAPTLSEEDGSHYTVESIQRNERHTEPAENRAEAKRIFRQLKAQGHSCRVVLWTCQILMRHDEEDRRYRLP